MKIQKALLIAAPFWLLTACSPNVDTRGHVLDADWQEHIQEGKSTRDEVMAQLGSPSTVSSFGEETWYYINLQRQSHAFFKPKVAEEEVVRLVFDGSGVVKSVDIFTEENMKDFAIAKRVTPTEGHQMTILEQTLGNIGRFNSPSGQTRNPRRPN